jgi:hypothetical protein
MNIKPDGYDYVRSYYNVPAYVGVRVKVKDREGVIVKPRHGGQYVDVLFDGDKRPTGPYHPNDLAYLVVGRSTLDETRPPTKESPR